MRALVVSCEHASCGVPWGLHGGLGEAALRSQASWDPGALPFARALAWRLGAPLIAGAVSRLVADLNRDPEGAGAVPEVSFGLEVPENRGLDPAARRRRLEAFHAPYRRALLAEVQRAAGVGCLHLSIHSFSPALDPPRRGFDVGVLLDPARPQEVRWAGRLRAALQAAGLDARLDEPYPGVGEGTTTWLRGQLPDARYAGLEIELSQAPGDHPRRALEALVGLLSGVS